MPNQATVFAENDEQYSNVSIVLIIGNKCSFWVVNIYSLKCMLT